MRFGLVHRITTDSLAVLGVLALVASGKLHLIATSAILLGLLAALFMPARFKQQGFLKLAGVVAPLLALTIQILRLILGADPIPVVVEFAALLQVIRLMTRRGAVHDHQVILLSLLHLIAGTVLGGGLTYALALIGFLVLTPAALVLSHLRREVEGNYRQGARDRTGMPVDVPRILRSRRVIGRGFLLFTCLLSLPVFLFTALLFLAFPRVGFSWLSVPQVQPQRVVGFSDRVDLGGVGTIRSDPALVMRVRPDDLSASPPTRRNLYLRGAVFDEYDGRSWSRSFMGVNTRHRFGGEVILRRQPRPSDRSYRIDLEPIQPAVVFVPGEAVALRVLKQKGRRGHKKATITNGPHGELQYTTKDQTGISYEVFLPPKGRVVPALAHAAHLEPYLEVPSELSPKVRTLARKLTEGAENPTEIALRLERELRARHRYDLNSPSGAAEDPLEHFLFESKRGHCEFYSTAMAMMLRVRGVPSRNVTGFVGGTYNRFGEFYAVRQGDAHSWVEAYLPSRGWTRFDPTPPSDASPQGETEGLAALVREMVEAAAQSWNQNVVGFDMEKQLGLFKSVRSAFRSAQSSVGVGKSAKVNTKRIVMVLGGGLLILLGVYAWRRNRQPSSASSSPSPARVLRTIELYRRLDTALAARGVARPPGTPPRTHALALCEAGHPTGEEALSLTEIYLQARYAGRHLSLAEERGFLRRVADLKKGERPRDKRKPRAA